MKRAGHLFEAVVEPANLELAFWKASRGKRARADQRAFAANLAEELARLREGLIDGTYPVGDYRRFTVYEPKERVICAAAFRERVLHHALMNVLEPWIEKWLIYDTYACRKGKGQLAAVWRAQGFARKYRYFLKCDIRKFFDSVPHEGIEEMLERKIKDRRVVSWLMKIVDTYETTPGRGLPIGNLTSQHLANLYLDKLDRYVISHKEHKEHREAFSVEPNPSKPGRQNLCDLCVLCGKNEIGYVRYMDDFVVWSDDKAALCRMRDAVAEFVQRELGLELKESPYINRTSHGMDFLGMRVYPGRVRANRASLERFERKAGLYDRLLADGTWSEAMYQERMTALTAFLQQADTLGWRRKASGSNRVQRGGSWNNNAQNCRSANRNNNNPSNRNNNNGFRLCCSAAPQDSENRAVPGAVPFAGIGRDGARPSRDEYPRPRGAGRRAAVAVIPRAKRAPQAAQCGVRPPCRAERHAGVLCISVQAKIGNADHAACAHDGEDVAGVVNHFVDDAVGLHDELAEPGKVSDALFKGTFGDAGAGEREFLQIVHGVADLEEPLRRRGDVALGGDCVVDFVELAERGGRPDDVHTPCLSRNRRMAVSWSTPFPSAISRRDARTALESRKTSISGSKSAALTRMVSARPLRVTTSGRCVSRTCAKQAARFLRHSENGRMSSVSRGRLLDMARVRIVGLLLELTKTSVQKNVLQVKGEQKI